MKLGKVLLGVLGILIFLLVENNIRQVSAMPNQKQSGGEISIDFQSHVEDEKLRDALLQAVEFDARDVVVGDQFIIVSGRNQENWFSFSMISVNGDNCQLSSETNHGIASQCTYSLLAQKVTEDEWEVGVRGTLQFLDLLRKTPDYFVSRKAKIYLDPLLEHLRSTEILVYKFPWVGTWQYWNGWHYPGGYGLDIGTSGSDKRVLASAPGTITFVCDGAAGSAFVTIQHDDGNVIDYVHLEYSTLGPDIVQFATVSQGQILGSLKSGSFKDDCGEANQMNVNAHLHWGFTSELPSYLVDGWTINYVSNAGCGPGSYWTQGASTVRPCQSPYNTLTSTNVPATPCCACALLNQHSPSFEIIDPFDNLLGQPYLQTDGLSAIPIRSLDNIDSAFHSMNQWTIENQLILSWEVLTDTTFLSHYSIRWSKSYEQLQSATPVTLTPQASGVRLPELGTGTWHVSLQTVDTAGRIRQTINLGPYLIDNDSPQLAASFQENIIWANNETITINTLEWPDAIDEHSGLAGYYVYWGEEAEGVADNFITDNSFEPPEMGQIDDGATRYLRVTPVDNVGNVGEWQTVVRWQKDFIAPTGSLAVAGGEVVRSLNANLNLNVVDQESGVSEMRFSNNGETWTEWETYNLTRQWQLANTEEPQLIFAQVRDAVGNVSEMFSTTVTAELNPDPPSSANYTVACSVLAMGGGSKSSGSYTVHSTVGQGHETGSLQSGSYQVHSGFWPGCGEGSEGDPTPTPTNTAAPTHTVTPTPSRTNTPTPTPPPTSSPTATPLLTNTPTTTASTITPTGTPSPTNSPTSTPSPTDMATEVPTSTPTATAVPTATSTPTALPTPDSVRYIFMPIVIRP